MFEKLGEWNNCCNDSSFVFQRETIISKQEKNTIVCYTFLGHVGYIMFKQ